MKQEEINRAIHDILTVLIHSTDNYEREIIDLNAVALLRKLSKLTKGAIVKCPECGREHLPANQGQSNR